MSEGGCCAPCGARPCAVAARLESTSAPLVAIAQVPRRSFETVVITDFPLTGWCPQSAPETYSKLPRRSYAQYFQGLAANVWPKTETVRQL
jgi:hypothetical protein